jgi:hypothetical protein
MILLLEKSNGLKNKQPGSPQYSIVVNGYMDIDGVKITSWDSEENSVVYRDSLE